MNSASRSSRGLWFARCLGNLKTHERKMTQNDYHTTRNGLCTTSETLKLADLGWTPTFDSHFRSLGCDDWIPGRVAREDRLSYVVYTESGSLQAAIAGKLRYEAGARSELPAVGDWVALEPRIDERRATIHAVLPRRSAFSRQSAGRSSDEQIIAANVSHVFVVCGLDGDYNLRRIERYLTLSFSSGATPIVVLNKADLCDDVDARISEVESVAPGTPIHAVIASSAIPTNRESCIYHSLDALRPYLQVGSTAALLGSSGVGKSTLLNSLLGSMRQETQAVRTGDDRGRHTTTHRELFLLPQGCDHRHSRHARAADVDRRGRPDRFIRRHRRVGCRMPIRQLPSRRRARLCGQRRRQ